MSAATAGRAGRRVAVWGACAALAAGVAGCGQAGAEPHVATAEGATPTRAASEQGMAEAYRHYADCLRGAGVTLLPETDGAPQVDKARTPLATIAAASEKCREISYFQTAPERISARDLAARRAYSVCVREHGVSYYPDPDPDTGDPVLDDATALRLKSDRTFSTAQEACRGGLPVPAEGDVLQGSVP